MKQVVARSQCQTIYRRLATDYMTREIFATKREELVRKLRK